MDGDYNEELDETVEEVAAAVGGEEESDEEDDDEEEEDLEEEDVSVEELTEIVKESGIDGQLSDAELSTKVLRGGKKIVRAALDSEDANERSQALAEPEAVKQVL